MAEPTIQLGNGNWAGKSDSLLGFSIQNGRFYEQEFTFSRSTTGTYTDSEGYIQEMPYNLLQQSNNFDTTWVLTNTTITGNQSGIYNSTDAWKLVGNGSNNDRINSNSLSSGAYTFSIYAKAGNSNFVAVVLGSGVVYYNLESGSIGSQESVTSASIESVGNEWYRLNMSVASGSGSVQVYIANAVGSVNTSNGDFVYIQNAQVNSGTSAKTYFPTTTRLNMPRVDYLNNSNGSLILEPQRTNLLPYSEDFSDSSWVKTNCNITSNNSTSPEGVQNATKLDFTTASGEILRTTSVTSGQQYTLSFYAKTESGTLDFNFGSISFATVSGTATTEWQRFEIVQTAASSTRYPKIQTTEIGSLLLWGAQVEQGSYATSYIPTSGSSVTRNADACSLTNVADRINSTEGVLFVETSYVNKGYGNSIAITDGTNSQRVQIYFNNSNLSLLLVVKVNDTIVGTHTVSSSGINWDSTNKIAIKYKTNDMSFWLNGTKVAEDTSGTMFSANTLTKLGFDSGSGGSFYGKCNQIQVYSTALSDTELAALTT
jgi:hypothetical protein